MESAIFCHERTRGPSKKTGYPPPLSTSRISNLFTNQSWRRKRPTQCICNVPGRSRPVGSRTVALDELLFSVRVSRFRPRFLARRLLDSRLLLYPRRSFGLRPHLSLGVL